MSTQFSKLEENILKSKGLSEEQLALLVECGIEKKSDFSTIGDVNTLCEVTGLETAIAEKVMLWALGSTAKSVECSSTSHSHAQAGASGAILIDSADVVYCQSCSAKQPKDYTTGDLCPNCGQQAEPICTCHWCGNVGPGQFCRGCGSKFVAFSDLDLAIQLRREGHSKDEIAPKLAAMSVAEKQTLWARVKARN
ncbi:MAG: hypothetical protein H6999_11560 [Hahellaceae bacterium]|nr:hypothetical protein [Hahellaceae bacterium]